MAEKKTGQTKTRKKDATLGDVFSTLSELIRLSWRRRKKKISRRHQEKKRVKPPLTKKQRLKRRKRRNRIIRRVFLSLFTLLLVLVGALACVLGTVFYGPSETACDLLVNPSLRDAAKGYFIANTPTYTPEELGYENHKKGNE